LDRFFFVILYVALGLKSLPTTDIDEAQSFLGYVLPTTLLFRIWFCSASPAHPSQEGSWWTEGSCSGESIINTVPAQRGWSDNQRTSLKSQNLKPQTVQTFGVGKFGKKLENNAILL